MAEPIEFAEANATFKGDGTKRLKDLRCHIDGNVTISCWKLSPEEIAEIVKTGVVWLGQMNYGKQLQPQAVWGDSPFRVPVAEGQA